ncbi:peptidase S8/S53 domain-containing protein [Zopfochytrium polystomum]|nr:peptidase S8/S53 domain-containing protein [Zopfochytrium polystomum]
MTTTTTTTSSPPRRASATLRHLLVLLLAACLAAGPAFVVTAAADASPEAAAANWTTASSPPIILPHLAMAEFPVGGGGGAVSCADSLASVQAHLEKKNVSYAVRTRTDTRLFCGLSFSVDAGVDALEAIADLPGLVASHPVQVHKATTTPPVRSNDSSSATSSGAAPSPIPATSFDATLHGPTGVLEARTRLNLTGAGVRVAIIDSGVYYLHPALGGCFGPSCTVAYGHDFVGDDYWSQNRFLHPDDDPIDDCSDEAHGSHVAGIVVGRAVNVTEKGFVPENEWTGVAPGVTIGAYRVFGCKADTTGGDVLAAALYRAAEDGSDVINLSIVTSPGFPESIETIAAQRVVASGVIVVWSNGNDGFAGVFSTSAEASSVGALGIGSADNPNYEFGHIMGSAFSSTGLDVYLNVKPDFCGFGGIIYSTISPFAANVSYLPSAYGYKSGTSMAAPYVAGAIALLLESRGGKVAPADVRTAFQNTATPFTLWLRSDLDSVAAQGAGLLNVYNAIIATTVVTPSVLALNDTIRRQDNYTLTITNKGAAPVEYTLSHQPSITTNPFDGVQDNIVSSPSYSTNTATVAFGPARLPSLTLTVPANASTTVTLNFDDPTSDAPLPLFSGYILLTPASNSTPPLRVPYAGIKGDWSTAPVFSVNSSNSFQYVTPYPATGFYPSTNASSPIAPAAPPLNASALASAPAVVSTILASTTRAWSASLVYTGSDPATLVALGALGFVDRNASLTIASGRQAARNSRYPTDHTFAPGWTLWWGSVFDYATNTSSVVPAGTYRVRFSGVRNLWDPAIHGDAAFEVVESNEFTLVN